MTQKRQMSDKKQKDIPDTTNTSNRVTSHSLDARICFTYFPFLPLHHLSNESTGTRLWRNQTDWLARKRAKSRKEMVFFEAQQVRRNVWGYTCGTNFFLPLSPLLSPQYLKKHLLSVVGIPGFLMVSIFLFLYTCIEFIISREQGILRDDISK